MLIEVYHAAFEDAPVKVAIVDAGERDFDTALEYAFERTNNIRGSWSRPATFEFRGEVVENGDFSENVEVVAELPVSKRTGEVMGLRSTSMGDFMMIEGRKMSVAAFGFKEIV